MKKLFILLFCLSALTLTVKVCAQNKDTINRQRVLPYDIQAQQCRAVLTNLNTVPTDTDADFLNDALAKYAPKDLKLDSKKAKKNYAFITFIYDKYGLIAYPAKNYQHKAANERPYSCKAEDNACLEATKCFEQAADKYMAIYNRLNNLAAPFYGKERNAFRKKFNAEYKGLLLQNCGGVNLDGTMQKECVCDNSGAIYYINTDGNKTLNETDEGILIRNYFGAPLYIKGKQKFGSPKTFLKAEGGPKQVQAEGYTQKACVYKFVNPKKAEALVKDFHFYPHFRQPYAKELCKVSKQWQDIDCAAIK